MRGPQTEEREQLDEDAKLQQQQQQEQQQPLDHSYGNYTSNSNSYSYYSSNRQCATGVCTPHKLTKLGLSRETGTTLTSPLEIP